MNHTDKLILLPMERYELLKRLAKPSQLPSPKQEVEEEPERKSMTLETIIKAMKGSDREYASKILKRIDPTLWDDAGVLIDLDIPVQDFVLDLKNAENNPPLPITSKRRQAIKHFIYKHTNIEPSMILNHKYVPYVKPVKRSVVEPVKTSIIKPVKLSTTQFKWLERR